VTGAGSVRPLAALQQTLAAEHAAVHAYAVLGGRVSTLEDPLVADLLRAAYEEHRARRDQLRSVIADLEKVPVAAAAGYDVDVRSREASELLRAARTTEERCAGFYAQLVASSVGRDRRWAITALQDSAVRLLALGGSPEAYPGADELERRS
jgi:Domain of unknown function (DUF4439)